MENYSVSLIIGAQVHNPQAAVDSFVESLVTSGLRNWIYIVTSDSNDDVCYSDGWGNLMDEEGMKRYIADREAGRPFPDQRITPEDEAEDEDDESYEGENEENYGDEIIDPEIDALLAKHREQQQMVVTVPAAVLNAAMEQVSND